MKAALRNVSFAHLRRPQLLTDLVLEIPTAKSVLLGLDGSTDD